ncbi:DUF2851 family protein [Muriicola soli]|uniref:DUF2851 family protein n=1 Tax=Muriicola soli TaxID=2507538 RepID=A0A411E7A8_9FLAO|nr:DUF2851 family protein [Muriicola soli]QBA63542.1 DUF2851 family protein [Muriicola soli]
MQEIVLHRIWESQLFPINVLTTTSGETIQVIKIGKRNPYSGPDFQHARIRIGDKEWSGHVELHIKASDWYLHGHQRDPAYDTVILHVVWEANFDVRRRDGTLIPTLSLSEVVSGKVITMSEKTKSPGDHKGLACTGLLSAVPENFVISWREGLFWQRLNKKCEEIDLWGKESNFNWELVLFKAFLKGFGLNHNGKAFLSLERALPFDVFRKLTHNLPALESLFFGLSGLLRSEKCKDPYFLSLRKEYLYLKTKYNLSADACHTPLFFSLRPHNFPTIRLSQLARLYHQCPNLFDSLRRAKSLATMKTLLNTRASPYWNSHYTFGKNGIYSVKKLSDSFKDLLLLNTVFPVLRCYGAYTGEVLDTQIKKWSKGLRGEQNNLIRTFRKEGIRSQNAYESQSLIHLYTHYCKKNKCLQCQWGTYILYGK